jgi:GT2 family glycosyltransferase
MQIYLIDDGSTDDTVFRIRNAYPNVKIIEGDGFWYWAKSMSVGDVYSSSDLRNVLWLNDDVRICPDSLSRSIELSNANPGSIIVGQCFSKESGALTYGGLSKHPWHPFKFSLIEATTQAMRCDTFNGNFVLIPRRVREVLGPIDGHFGHRFADLDYGLRSSKQGFSNLILPGVAGHCERNVIRANSNPIKRVIETGSVKNLPFKALRRFTKKHASHGAWIYILAPYIKAFLGIRQREISKDSM